jgi:manganese efflux pump family protein
VLQARRHRSDHASVGTRLGRLLVTGAALSIDNLVVGFALGTHKVSLALAAVVIAVVSVAMSLVGLELGRRLGRVVEEWSDEISGGVLILVGAAIALRIF